ncbi:uncharacterized protein LOC107367819 [Tetranychus urticae]|uniref:Uncharacterized protein n=1 Tax=Tetranychus urticae TaxID=32264 RepID=T1KW77_TETUR|nr:uncharacterized protein LOC107367819 [Tetranychus urticae]
MDNSLKNIEKEDNLDKVTIKVKVEDEGYHDIVIDWSDGSSPYKDQQVINQLSTIIGIPVELIWMTILDYAPLNYFDLQNIEHRSFDPWFYEHDAPDENEPDFMPCNFTRENCLGRLNDGDRFVLRTDLTLWVDGCFSLDIYLYSLDCELYNENNCTQNYCHYSNTRAFIDRRISVVRNTELHNILRARYAELPPSVDLASSLENSSQRRRILRELGVKVFFWGQRCSFWFSRRHHRHNSPYSRTRG